MGFNEPVDQITLTAEVVAVIDAAVKKTVTETVADMLTVDQVNTLIKREIADALQMRPTLQDVRQLIDREIQDLLSAVQEVKQAVAEVVQLKQSIARIEGILTAWTKHRDEIIDEVRRDQDSLSNTQKELSTTVQQLSANQRQFRDTVYGDPSVKDGPQSLLSRLQTVEGGKLDNTVFERVFLPVMEFVNVQRLAAQTAQEKRQRRQAILNRITDMLSVQRAGGLGALVGVVVKFFGDNL